MRFGVAVIGATGYIGAAYRAEIRSFVDSALAGAEPVVSGADGRAAVAAVLAANRSWQESRPVDVVPA